MSDLHTIIYNAKLLLLKESELKRGHRTFTDLANNFNLSQDILMSFFETGLIKLDNFSLHQLYIKSYKHQRKSYEETEEKKRLASHISPNGNYDPKKTEKWKNYLTDPYCGLGKGLYNKLLGDGLSSKLINNEMELDIFNFRNLIRKDISRDFVGFNIDFSAEKIQKFLTEIIDSFTKDELDDLIDDKNKVFLSYGKQKADFIKSIITQIDAGYPPNNLKVKYNDIWSINVAPKTNFLETALGMEREGLIEIRDLIEEGNPHQFAVVVSDLYFKSPATIQIKALKGLYDYHPTKYYPIKQERQLVQATQEPQEQKNNEKNVKPFTRVENGRGYFKFYKEGVNIEISGADTRPFKLLQCLCNPSFGIQKTTEEIFDSIKLQKDLKDSVLSGFDSPQRKSKITTIIKNSCIKELQKIKELEKLKYKFNPQETKMWLSLEE